MMRQLHFAMLDLELHARFKPGGKETVFDVDHRIAQKTMVMPPLPEDRYCTAPTCSSCTDMAGALSPFLDSLFPPPLPHPWGSLLFSHAGALISPIILNTASPSPYPTLPYPTLPYPTLPYPTLPYPTLPYPTLLDSTL